MAASPLSLQTSVGPFTVQNTRWTTMNEYHLAVKRTSIKSIRSNIKDNNISPVTKIPYCEVALHFLPLPARCHPVGQPGPDRGFLPRGQHGPLLQFFGRVSATSPQISAHYVMKNKIIFARLMFCVHEAGRGVWVRVIRNENDCAHYFSCVVNLK